MNAKLKDKQAEILKQFQDDQVLNVESVAYRENIGLSTLYKWLSGWREAGLLPSKVQILPTQWRIGINLFVTGQ